MDDEVVTDRCTCGEREYPLQPCPYADEFASETAKEQGMHLCNCCPYCSQMCQHAI